jgi:hypothetical protein
MDSIPDSKTDILFFRRMAPNLPTAPSFHGAIPAVSPLPVSGHARKTAAVSSNKKLAAR